MNINLIDLIDINICSDSEIYENENTFTASSGRTCSFRSWPTRPCHYLRLKMRSNEVRLSWQTVHRLSTQMNASESVQLQVRQNTEPNVELRMLAISVKWQNIQRIGR